MKTIITEDDVEHWIGGEGQWAEAMEVLTSIANGEYKPELFREEVLMLREDEES